MYMSKLKNKKGFALLYAILLSGAVLAVGVILMNIITKQLSYSSINQKSEVSYYYAANSGRECLEYYAGRKPTDYFYKETADGVNFKDEASFRCLSVDVVMVKGGNENNVTFNLKDNVPISVQA